MQTPTKRIVVAAGRTTVVEVVLGDGRKTLLEAAIATAVMAVAVRATDWSPIGSDFSLGKF